MDEQISISYSYEPFATINHLGCLEETAIITLSL